MAHHETTHLQMMVKRLAQIVKMMQKAVITAKQKSMPWSSGRKQNSSAGPVQAGMTPRNTQSFHPARNAVLARFLLNGQGHPATHRPLNVPICLVAVTVSGRLACTMV